MKSIVELLEQETVTDAEIMNCRYAVKNYYPDRPTQEEIDRLNSMADRLKEIEAMERDARQAGRGGIRTQIADCGHYTNEVMSTSQGSSCPRCYDRMSE